MAKLETNKTDVQFSDTGAPGWLIGYTDTGGKNPTGDAIAVNLTGHQVEMSNKEFDALVELLLEVQMDIGMKKDAR